MTNKIKVMGWASLAIFMLSTLAFVGYYLTINEPVSPTTATQSDSKASDEEIEKAFEALVEEQETEEALEPSSKATATLDSLRDNGNEFAIATRDFNTVTDSFTIEVLATLGDPQPKSKYIVVLKGPSGSTEIGTLSKETENTYSLSYASKEDITDLGTVVIIESGSKQQEALKGIFE